MTLIPDDLDTRTIWLFILLIVLSAIGLQVLSEVFWTIFLAAVFGYVLYPVKERIHRDRFTDRQSAALVTAISFLLLITLVAPIFLVLFQRRQILLDFITSLPNEITVDLFEFSFTYPTVELEIMAKNWVINSAVKLAESLPSLSVKAFLFVFVLYAILKHPKMIEKKILGLFPESAESALRAYHERIKQTLVGIFAVQTLTAVATFIIALPVFYFLGYKAFISLALISAILQFIPIIGPSILILALAGLELAAGFPIKALMILVFGIVIIGFLPDAYLRPKLAGKTTGLPASLYFIGFAGGALTLGAVGVLAGPLSIALIIETINQIAE